MSVLVDADLGRQRFFSWYLFGVAGCASPILYSTVNTIVKDDSEERAVILVSSVNMLSPCGPT